MHTTWKNATLLILLLGALLMPSSVQAATPIRLTLGDLGYDTLDLYGMYGNATVWVPFASDWRFEDSITLELHYRVSPLLNTNRSTLTLLANDLEILSLRPIADGQPHTITAEIPLDRLQGKGLSLRFQAYARLTNEACEETNNPAQWMQILPETALLLRPLVDDTPPDLSSLDAALFQDSPISAPPPVWYILPDEPDAQTLAAAAQTAMRLGMLGGNTAAEIRVWQASEISEQQLGTANLVLIGRPADNPWIAALGAQLPAPLRGDSFYTAQGHRLPDEDGVLAVALSPWNPARRVLLVSGNAAAGLQKASQALADEVTFRSLTGRYQFVRHLVVGYPPPAGQAWQGETTTFAQLGDRDRSIVGTGSFREYFFFQRPPGWLFDQGAQITLHLAYSPVLRAQESYLSVFINDVFIGAARLGDGMDKQEITFDLPIQKLNRAEDGSLPQDLTVRVHVGSFLSETNCEQTHPEAAWVKIYASSYFTTPHVYLVQPDLQAFPYPFVSDVPDAPRTAIVLPPSPTSRELTGGIQLAHAIARRSPQPVPLLLTTADQVSPLANRDDHLIVLGTRERQPMTQELLDTLGAIPGYQGEYGLYQAINSPYDGLLRAAPSPWNQERLVLLIFSETQYGLENALQVLLQKPPIIPEGGSVVQVTADNESRVIYRTTDAAPSRTPVQIGREPLLPRPEPWVVVSLILLGAFLTVAVVIWAAARKRDAER